MTTIEFTTIETTFTHKGISYSTECKYSGNGPIDYENEIKYLICKKLSEENVIHDIEKGYHVSCVSAFMRNNKEYVKIKCDQVMNVYE